MIEFKNIYKKYGAATVLDDLSFTVETGELVVMIGPSGCGKTTSLKTINRLVEPDSGSVLVDGKDIAEIDKVALRRSIGYVIQQIGLFPNMNVEQNIGVVPRLSKYGREKTSKIVHELLEMVDMPYEEYAHKYPSQLSGGQQQRVGVLRALAASPPIVLMDEPFGALDPVTRTMLQKEVLRLQKQLNKTMIFVTHDMNEALSIADKIIFMDKGQIIQTASPDELLSNPANDLVRDFMKEQHLEADRCSKSAEDALVVPPDISIGEAVDLMAGKGAEALTIKSPDGTYLGTFSLREEGHE